MFAAATGDALGSPIKASSVVRRIHFKYGKEAPSRLAYAGAPPAQWTDETQQLLFVADGLIRHAVHGGQREHHVRDALRCWLLTQKGPGVVRRGGWLMQQELLFFRRLPERVVELALGDAAERPGAQHAPMPNEADGPTAVTRAVPYAICAPTADDAFAWACHDAGWTHGDPVVGLCAGAFAALLHPLLRGAPLADALNGLVPLLHQHEGLEGPVQKCLTTARHIAAGGPPEPHHLEALGDGRDAGSAFTIALTCTMALEDATPYGFVRALWRAACHGGSSDTTSCLTGALAGALLGVDAIPHPWLIDLAGLEILDRMATDLWAVSTLRPIDVAAYAP